MSETITVPGFGTIHRNHLGFDIIGGNYTPVMSYAGGPRKDSEAASFSWDYTQTLRLARGLAGPPEAALPLDVARNLSGWLPWFALNVSSYPGTSTRTYLEQSLRDSYTFSSLFPGYRALAAYQWALMSKGANHWRLDSSNLATVYNTVAESPTLVSHVTSTTSGSSLAAFVIDTSTSFRVYSLDDLFIDVIQPVAALVDHVVVVAFAAWGTDGAHSTFNYDGSPLSFTVSASEDYASSADYDRSATTVWSGAGSSLPTGAAWDDLMDTVAYGGDDEPETHLDGMRHAIGWAAANGSWATKHMIVLSGSPWIAPLASIPAGIPPLRQNQRDDARQNQRTSQQLTVRQRGYL